MKGSRCGQIHGQDYLVRLRSKQRPLRPYRIPPNLPQANPIVPIIFLSDHPLHATIKLAQPNQLTHPRSSDALGAGDLRLA